MSGPVTAEQAGPDGPACFGLPAELRALQAEAREVAMRARADAASREWLADPRERVSWELV
ncbi:MAG: hypothetical protein ACRDYD_04610, partial [Acidimicrobiales bacterium]